MTKKEVIEKYKAGFTVYGKHPITDEEWLLDVSNSTSECIIFLGYDANMFPMPEWTAFNEGNYWDNERVKVCKKVTKNFKGKVYMDSVCISDIGWS